MSTSRTEQSSHITMSSISDFLTDMIVICNGDYTITEGNRRAQAIEGKGEDLVGQYCYAVFHERDAPCEDCPLATTIAKRKIQSLNYFDKRFGEFFEERTYPLVTEDGDIQQFIISNRNVSQQREAEDKSAQMKKLAAIGKLSSGAAHDFNNVISGVLGRLHMLRKVIDKPDVLEHLDVMEDAVHTGSETVRRMLDFARGGGQRNREVVSVSKLLESVIFIAQPKWMQLRQEQGIIIELVTELEPDLYIEVERSEFINALTNLLINAVDAMPDGGVLHMAAKKVDTKLELSIQDTGVGMSNEIRDRIFDPFFTTKGEQGNGLGLSEVFGTIKRHDAQIYVDTAMGSGTTFTIKIPMAEPVQVENTRPATPVKNMKILAVDDELYMLDTLKDVLTENGHAVTTSISAQEALTHLAKDEYDLLITDMEMPEMSGRELAASVRATQNPVSILILSGWPIDFEAEKDLAELVDGSLTKPFTIDDLLNAIQASTAQDGDQTVSN